MTPPLGRGHLKASLWHSLATLCCCWSSCTSVFHPPGAPEDKHHQIHLSARPSMCRILAFSILPSAVFYL